VGTGSVAESYAFLPVSGKGFPVILAARYSSSNDTPAVTARVPFTITTQTPARASWSLEFQGKVYAGEGYDARATWDTRNALGQRVAPGLYPYSAAETFHYDSGAQPSLVVSGTVEVRRGDVWPLGFNWISSYDTLLVDNSGTVTVIQGDGQYLTYTRKPDGSYTAPAGDFERLVRDAGGAWTRTSGSGTVETFSALGRLTRLQDPNGNAHTFSYEPAGGALPSGAWKPADRLTAITDASGRAWKLDYGADGYVSKVTDPLGGQYTLAHDAAGNLVAITDPLSRTTTYEYDANHLLTRVIDPLGHATRVTYDANRRVVSHKDALDHERTVSYGESTTTVVNERGFPTTYQSNSFGAITRTGNPVQTFNYTYDDQRQLSGSDAPAQRMEYDERGNLTSYSSFTEVKAGYYASSNRLSTFTDGAGNTLQLAYDAHGNPTKITDPLGKEYRLEYDAAGQITRLIDPLGQTTSMEYDVYGNMTRVIDPLGADAKLTYDAAGNLQTATDAENHSASFVYDGANRLKTATDALGRTTAYEYDAGDNLKKATDARGNKTNFTYDALNRISTRTDALGNTTAYVYDPAGNLAGLTDANGATTQLTYDAANRLTGIQYPGGGAVTMGYNTIGDLTGYLDAGTQVTFTHTSGIPGSPDLVETRGLGNPAIHSQVTYDYATSAGTALMATGSVTRGAPAQAEVGLTALPQPGAVEVEQETALPPAAPEASPPAPAGSPDQGSAGPLPPAPTPVPAEETPQPPEMPPAEPYSEQFTPQGTIVGGLIGTNTTWALAGSPYIIGTSSVTVAPGVTLTIDPGVVVKVDLWSKYLYVNGALHARGDAAHPIIFTSYKDDSAAGDTNGDDGATLPAPGDWGAVQFNSGSTGSVLDYVVARYGGASSGANVIVNSTAVALTNSTFARGNFGLLLNNALPPALTANQFISNTNCAINAPLTNNAHSITLRGNTGSGNAANGVCTGGTLSGSPTWDGDANFPFVLTGDLTVNAGAKLTLAPGAILKLNHWARKVAVNGTLIADGDDAHPIIFTSITDDAAGGDTNNNGATPPVNAEWNAVRFEAGSAGSLLDHVTLRYGGANYGASVMAYTTGVTLTDDLFYRGNIGVLLNNALPPVLTGNSFISNTNCAINAPLTDNAHSTTLRGNTASGNGVNGFCTGGTVSGSPTWDGDPNFPFVLTGDLTVNAGAKLTVKPGTIFKLNLYSRQLFVNGALDARGDAARPIVFTSIQDDSIGGDTDNDHGATLPAAGNWRTVRFANTSAGSALDYVTARYGGSTFYGQGCVHLSAADMTLTNSTFVQCQVGLSVSGASPAITGNGFISNTNCAVISTLTDNPYSITLFGNTATGNGVNGFCTGGTVSGSPTWDGDPNLPFVLTGDLTVNAGAKLTLKPGTIFKLNLYSRQLFVNGALDARGDAARPIVFTSFLDDSIGGDTDNDHGSTRPAAGNWRTVRFANTSTGSVLDYVTARFGGSAFYGLGCAHLNTPDITLTNSTFAQCEFGLSVSGASPAITGNTFTANKRGVYTASGARPVFRRNRIAGNTEWGFYNADSSVIVDAEHNQWGGSKGPYDPSDDRPAGGLYNPQGDGDRVTDKVDYAPWDVISGLLYGISLATGSNPVQTVRYGYDPLNRLSSLAASGPAAFVRQYAYDPAGRLTGAGPAPGNAGITTNLEYDAASRLTRLVNRSPDGGATFNDFKYVYDKAGYLLSAQDATGATTFTYDAQGQVTGASGPGLNETYSYDETGNRLGKSGVTYTYNAGNQLVSSSDGTAYTYDKNGNLRTRTKSGQTTTYTWDAEDRLVRIDFPDSAYAAYTYDTLGHRLSKRDRTGVTTYYVYEGLDLVQEVNAAGTVIAGYVYDGLDHPLSMTRGGATYYYLFDRLGNVVGLTDGAGGLLASYRYDPWGNVIAMGGSNPSLANPFRFTGREWDAESGLYYFRARYYDPATGRFVGQDPLNVAWGPDFVYAMNNPIAFRDRLGLTLEQDLQLIQWFERLGWAIEEPHLQALAAVRGLGNPAARAAQQAITQAAPRLLPTVIGQATRLRWLRAALAGMSKVALVALAKLAAAFAVGYGIGYMINKHLLDCGAKEAIGEWLLTNYNLWGWAWNNPRLVARHFWGKFRRWDASFDEPPGYETSSGVFAGVRG